jgi:hypothetical protein
MIKVDIKIKCDKDLKMEGVYSSNQPIPPGTSTALLARSIIYSHHLVDSSSRTRGVVARSY